MIGHNAEIKVGGQSFFFSKGSGKMGASNWVTLDVAEIKKETEKAFLVRLCDREELWIPKGQMADPEEYKEGDCDCQISISEFIAREKGIEVL